MYVVPSNDKLSSLNHVLRFSVDGKCFFICDCDKNAFCRAVTLLLMDLRDNFDLDRDVGNFLKLFNFNLSHYETSGKSCVHSW